jgi:ribosomal protein S12 methylthiotransferase accessory factor
MCDRINRLGYDISLFDMRLDMPLPVVLAVATRRDGGKGRLSLAAGAGLDPLAAIWGAVCEIATYIGSMEERVSTREAELREMAADFTKVLGLEDNMLLFGLPEMFPHAQFLWENPRLASAAQVYAGWETERPRNLDQADDIQYCLDVLVKRGLDQVIVVDQTTREQRALGLHTACAIVPGLVPIDFGYEKRRYLSLERTYTVPRIAGLRDRDLVATDLNQMPHPFP